MPKILVISSNQLIKVLHKLGYTIVKQRGSHIKLKKVGAAGTHSITGPES